MAQAATTAYQQLSARLGEAGTGVPVPSALHDLVEELVVLQSARQYLQYLQVQQRLACTVQCIRNATGRRGAGGGWGAIVTLYPYGHRPGGTGPPQPRPDLTKPLPGPGLPVHMGS